MTHLGRGGGGGGGGGGGLHGQVGLFSEVKTIAFGDQKSGDYFYCDGPLLGRSTIGGSTVLPSRMIPFLCILLQSTVKPLKWTPHMYNLECLQLENQ